MNYAPQKMPTAHLAAPPPKITWRTSKTAIKVISLAVISLTAGLVFRAPADDAALATDTQQPPAITTQAPAMLTEDMEVDSPIEIHHYLASVSLDTETQDGIWALCGGDAERFAAVMAMANRESRFDVTASGDNGNSLGLLQIQPRWHQERMDRLGVTDLMDPIQNTKVALDYIDWLIDCLDLGEKPFENHALYMAYNMGLSGYRNSGYSTSPYSREVMGYFYEYLDELGVRE